MIYGDECGRGAYKKVVGVWCGVALVDAVVCDVM